MSTGSISNNISYNGPDYSETSVPEQCSSCKFFKLTNGISEGECHRHAPIIAVSGHNNATLWPHVAYQASCGDWKPSPTHMRTDRRGTGDGLKVNCPDCKGLGSIGGEAIGGPISGTIDFSSCPKCKGTGQVRENKI